LGLETEPKKPHKPKKLKKLKKGGHMTSPLKSDENGHGTISWRIGVYASLPFFHISSAL
jgi:hypothetical protein